MKSFTNIVLGAVGGILGNLIAAMIQQDAWGNVFTPVRILATVAGLIAVIIVLTILEMRAQKTEQGQQGIIGNVQIGPALIRVLRGTNVINNIQIGGGRIIVDDASTHHHTTTPQKRP